MKAPPEASLTGTFRLNRAPSVLRREAIVAAPAEPESPPASESPGISRRRAVRISLGALMAAAAASLLGASIGIGTPARAQVSDPDIDPHPVCKIDNPDTCTPDKPNVPACTEAAPNIHECSATGSNSCLRSEMNTCMGGKKYGNSCTGSKSNNCDGAHGANTCHDYASNVCSGTDSNNCSGGGIQMNNCMDGSPNSCTGTNSNNCSGSTSNVCTPETANTCSGTNSNQCTPAGGNTCNPPTNNICSHPHNTPP